MIYKFINIPNHQLISDKVYTYVSTRTGILSGKAIWNWTTISTGWKNKDTPFEIMIEKLRQINIV